MNEFLSNSAANQSESSHLKKTVAQLFEEQVERTPENIAVSYEGQTLSYGELNEKSNQLARHLRASGVKHETLVAIMLERGLDMIISILGILKAGGAYLPIDSHYPEKRIQHMLEDSRSPIIITQSNIIITLKNTTIQIFNIDQNREVIYKYAKNNLSHENQAGDLAQVIYTSGSTGRPKGVLILNKGIIRLVKNTNYIKVNLDDKILQASNISFDAATLEIWAALLNGASLTIISKEDFLSPSKFSSALENNNITMLFLTTAMFVLFAIEIPRALHKVRTLLVGGELLNKNIAKDFLAINENKNTQLIHAYGPTENTTLTTFYEVKISSCNLNSLPIGKAITGTEVFVLNKDLSPCNKNVIGELYTAGDGLALGYLNQPQLTAEKFINTTINGETKRLYKTGDLVRELDDGNIEFIGRADNQVKIRGYRIELGEIEAAILQHPSVTQCAVIAKEVDHVKKLLAFMTLAGEKTDISLQDWNNFLLLHIPEYMLPAAFLILNELPLTPNLKIDKKALSEQKFERAKIVSPLNSNPPTTVEEIQLVDIFAKVLLVLKENIGITDSFFMLGGDSIIANQIVIRIRNIFKVEITIADLFNSPSVEKLLARINELKEKPEVSLLPALSAISKKTNVPLSLNQQRLWFLAKLEPNNPFYNAPIVLKLEGILDYVVLEQTFNELIKRHEVFRTRFYEKKEKAIQAITSSKSIKFKLRLEDFSQTNKAMVEKAIQDEANTPFVIENTYLYRIRLLKTKRDQHILIINMHHIITDGWSVDLLYQELSIIYDAFIHQQTNPLPALTLQPSDYVAWEQANITGTVLSQQLAYWKNQLKDVDPLNLATDYARPAQQTYAGDNIYFSLPDKLTKQLTDLAKANQTTLFTILLSALDILLYRYTEHTDIVIGTAFANRNQQALESMLGFFVNTLPIRTQINGNQSFLDVVENNKQLLFAAQNNSLLPFDTLIEAVNPTRDTSQHPLFQIYLELEPTIAYLPHITEKTSLIKNKSSRAKFDLTLLFENTESGLEGNLEYYTAIFSQERMREFISHYLTLLNNIVQDAKQVVTKINILPDEQKQKVLYDWNNTQADFDLSKTIIQLFEEKASQVPSQTAVIFENQKINYCDLNEKANQLAHYLRELGVKTDTIVALMMDRNLEMIVAILAILKAGAAYMPLDPHYPETRIQYMLENSQAPFTIIQSHLTSHLSNTHSHIIEIDKLQTNINKQSKNNLNLSIKSSNLAYIIYTSGSTGQPKGILLEHKTITNLITWQSQKNEYENKKIAQFATFSFDVSVQEIFLALLNGSELIVIPEKIKQFPNELLKLLEDEKVNTLFIPTTFLKFLAIEANHHEYSLESLQRIIVAGEALVITPDIRRFFIHYKNITLENQYGPSETHVVTSYTLNKLPTTWPDIPPIGAPIFNTKAYVVDSQFNLMPPGVPGKLYLAGTGLARSYLNRPETTNKKFIRNPINLEERIYCTGDIAKWDNDGSLKYLGRSDNQIKYRGFRIEPGEIETALSHCPGVKQACIILYKQEDMVECLIAYFTTENNQEISSDTLKNYISEKLPSFMLPTLYIRLEKMPLTPSGKIDKLSLLKTNKTKSNKNVELATPKNDLQKTLLLIWNEAFKSKNMGVQDNFFEAGGHSLGALRLVDRIRKKVKTPLSVRMLFENPTVESLSKAIEKAAREEQVINESPIITLQHEGNKTPLFLIHPVGGTVFWYKKLSQYLKPDRPIFGIEDPAVKGSKLTFDNFIEMASYYLAAIKAKQAHGPYLLGGASFGGTMAVEIAQQLQAQGEKVELIILFDSWAKYPTKLHNKNFFDSLMKEQAGKLIENLKKHRIAPKKWVDLQWHRANLVWNYIIPKKISNKIILYKSQQTHFSFDEIEASNNYWNEYTKLLDTEVIPGNHETIFEEPNVQFMANKLQNELDKLKQ